MVRGYTGGGVSVFQFLKFRLTSRNFDDNLIRKSAKLIIPLLIFWILIIRDCCYIIIIKCIIYYHLLMDNKPFFFEVSDICNINSEIGILSRQFFNHIRLSSFFLTPSVIIIITING